MAEEELGAGVVDLDLDLDLDFQIYLKWWERVVPCKGSRVLIHSAGRQRSCPARGEIRMRVMRIAQLATGAVLLAVSAAEAADTGVDTHDARGRIADRMHTGSLNNIVVTSYAFDKAGNRRKVQTNGASASSSLKGRVRRL